MSGSVSWKKLYITMLVIGLVGSLSLLGCAPEEEPADTIVPPVEEPAEEPEGQPDEPEVDPQAEEDARNLYNDAEGYTEWETAPGFETRQPSVGPHGEEVDIFVNDEVVQALDAGDASEWPVGSIVSKDYFVGGELAGIVMLEKREDGRFWAMYTPDGDVEVAGLLHPMCEECHAGGSDGMLGFSLP